MTEINIEAFEESGDQQFQDALTNLLAEFEEDEENEEDQFILRGYMKERQKITAQDMRRSKSQRPSIIFRINEDDEDIPPLATIDSANQVAK